MLNSDEDNVAMVKFRRIPRDLPDDFTTVRVSPWKIPYMRDLHVYTSTYRMAGNSCSGDDIVPDRRNGGCGALMNNKLYFWGGETEDTLTFSNSDDDDDDSDDSEEEEEEGEEERMKSISVPVNLPRPPDHPFDVLDIPMRTWTRQPTKGFKEGDIPGVGIGSTITYHPGTHSSMVTL